MLLNLVGTHVLPILACVGFAGLGVYHIARAFSARKWPKVLGTIEETNVIRMDRRGSERDFAEYVRYRYEVHGSSYTNDRMQFGVFSTSLTSHAKKAPSDSATRDAAEHLAHEYRAKSAIVVYYNPRSPVDSTLYASVDAHTWWLVIGGIAFVVTTVLFS